MPSKRHGYLTRKEWLRERLEDARDKAGAFDVERLLRRVCMTTLLQEVERGPICYTDDGIKRIVEAMNKATQHVNLAEVESRAVAYFLESDTQNEVAKLQRMSPPLRVAIMYSGPVDFEIEFPK